MSVPATRIIRAPAAVHSELLDIVRDALGRAPDSHEVGATLAKVVRTAKAATRNADKVRHAAQQRNRQKYDEDIQRARTAHAARIGRPDLLHSVYRSGEGAAPDAPKFEPDRPVGLVTSYGEPLSRAGTIPQALTPRFGFLSQVAPGPADMGSMTGVTGTPFSSVPNVELNAELYPYLGRGLAYNYGQFQAMYRSDAILREGIANLVSVQAGATIEFTCPSALTQAVADRLGIDRDRISRAADELNTALQLGRHVEFMAMFREQMRTACINGFGLLEFAIDANAKAVTQRITGLQPRLPNTVVQWIQDPVTGECVAILQTNAGQTYQPSLALDARKVVRMSIDQDGDNFEGVSLCRSARAWDVLEFEFVSSAILHRQRFGPGVPIIMRKAGAPNSGAASDSTFAALANYANLADAVLEVGADVDVDIKQVLAEQGLAEIVEMCGKRKRAAVRDSISGLGTDGVGTYSLGEIKSQLWMQSLRSFAQDSERGWNQLARVYCDMFHPGLDILPVMSITGFASRSPVETLNIQTSFLTIAATGQMTNQELSELAESTGVVWSGRADEADTNDNEAMETAAPAAPVPTGLEEPAAESGKSAPSGAQRAAAEGKRAKASAPAESRWTPTMADATLAKKVLSGAPLEQSDLRMLEAFFTGIDGDPTQHPEWADRGPFYQQFQSLGGVAMAEWLKVRLADVDDVPAEPDDGDALPDDPPATRAPQKYAHIDFTPPQGVRAAAKRGLEVRASKPPSERGGTEVGVARARDLSNGREVSPDTARRMKAYFDRHEVDKQGETWDEQGKGWQAWHLWGGDPGQSWSAKLVRQMNAADESPRVADGESPRVAANDDATPRTLPGFGRHAGDCGCGECATTPRARKALFAVPTRTGEFLTWRELRPVEQAVSFDGIAAEKSAAVDRMTRAIEAEQRQHRAAYAAAAQPLIDRRDVAGIARLSVDFTERYRQAMLPALRSLSEFSNADMLAEIAAQTGSRTWTASSDTVTGSVAQVEAAATLAATAVNDRVNEQLRGAAVQVVNGARPATLTAAPLSIGNTAGGLLEQTASTTVNETRAVTAAEQGPRIVKAVYSAVMDRYTCPECARADGTEVEYGSERYRRLSPPNPRCKSVVNSGGLRNLCQCVWVYEYATPTTGPGPINPTRTGGLEVRSATRAADAAPVRVVLVAGLPGAGKSTWAVEQPGVVIDRDEYVLTGEGYNADGRAESMAALVDAVEATEPGSRVLFVACLLSPGSRARVCEFVRASTEVPVEFELVAFDAHPDRVREVNEARADTERGMIPPDQLEHFIDAWQLPYDEEANEYVSVQIV